MDGKDDRMSRRHLLGIAAIAVMAGVAVVATLSAHAATLGVVDGEDLDVAADRVEVDVEHGMATLDGNVTIHLGGMDVRCPTVQIRYDKSPRVSFARGSGGITAHFQGIDATAATLEFDARARTVALHGSVRLSRGRGWVTAENATVDLASGKVSLQGEGSIPVEPVRR